MIETRYDVVTLGETMIRLTPPHMERIENTRTFEVHVGGSESNTAVGLARLGIKTCWLSRLTDNPLGRAIMQTLRGQGVDTDHVVWTPEDRVGTYYYEPAAPPRASRVIYDRAASAFSRMGTDDIPVELFTPDGARLLHLTGISLAVGAHDAALRARDLASDADWYISFDLNYRSKLWSPAEALATCEPFMRNADVLIVSLNDARTLFDPRLTWESALDLLGSRYKNAFILLTMGADGAAARGQDGAIAHQPANPSQEVGRLGRGDAFTAGALCAFLEGRSADEVLRWGAACAALKNGIPGDLPLFNRAEVERVIAGGGAGVQR